MLKKISIHIKNEFADDVWKLVFNLYDFCHGEYSKFGVKDFDTLNTVALAIRYHEDVSPVDAIAVFGKRLDYLTLTKELRYNTEFFISVVYIKNNNSIGDPNFLPLISWLTRRNTTNEHTDFSFGVDISEIDEKSKNRYLYSIGQRLSIIDEWPVPRASKRSVYYIDDKNGSKFTKIFPYSRSHNAPGSRKSLLLPIDKYSLDAFFNSQKRLMDDNYGQTLLIKSIKSFNIPIDVDDTSCLLEEWLANAYMDTLNLTDNRIKQKYDEIKDSLHEYSNNIYELVQNIIFHTKEKTGWLSMRFYKKSDLHVDLRKKIPFFGEYTDDDRFLVFELSDNGEKGIVETYGEANLSLSSFFDPKEILPDDCLQLSLRYVSHLGIKTFVSSVLNHGGYFYVESNSFENRKDKIESHLGVINEISDFAYEEDGTLYRVVLPVNQRFLCSNEFSITINRNDKTTQSITSVPRQSQFKPLQLGAPSLYKENNELLTFQLNNLPPIQFDNCSTIFESKAAQILFIKEKGDEIIRSISTIQGKNVSIDMSKYVISNANLFFKIIAYVRLNISTENQPETIVCYNLTDEAYDELHSIIINQNDAIAQKGQPIWSNEYAIVLMASTRIEILCGETKELFRFVNSGLSRFYFFEEYEHNESKREFINNSKKIEKFIRPYDMFVGVPSLFETTLKNILNREIDDVEQNVPGCLVNIPARLGEKIYIEKFYQADHLFQESYYAERFALCIARDYLRNLKVEDDLHTKNVIILSYNKYSKLLTEYVKNYLESAKRGMKGSSIHVASIVTGIEDSETDEMRFDISGDISLSNAYSVITIVPIATTLTTFEKLGNYFQQYYEKKQFKGQLGFEYKYCSILVRDKARKGQNGCSKMESEWNWNRYYANKKIVFTVSPQPIHFSVVVETFWHHLIDNGAFPPSDKFDEEKFILRTHNSSLHVNNILGYPDVFIEQDIQESEKRLEELKQCILFGHIIHNNKHHRYYFDIPRYIELYQNNEKSQLRKWISGLKMNEGQINIIVTSEPDKNPQLTTFIKEYLFGNRAHILSLDLFDRNIQYKYSFLWLIKNVGHKVKYYFVDQAILTGNAYYMSKRQMSSILGKSDFKFDYIITIINRLSKSKYYEICNDLAAVDKPESVDKNSQITKNEKRIYSFVQFFIPPSKLDDTGCYICNMESFFRNLKKNSVITDCRNIIELNRRKYLTNEYDKVKNEYDLETNSSKVDFERFYKRMIWQNRLFYKISNTLVEKPDSVKRGEAISELISELHEESKKNIDDHISFIKAISTPPISEYARIRKIALHILLVDLSEVINKEKPRINDLFLLKVLLKHLALLESNALVREKVIVGSWETYHKIKEQLLTEIHETKAAVAKYESPQKANDGQGIIPFYEKIVLPLKMKLNDIYDYIGFTGSCGKDEGPFLIQNLINDEKNKLNQFPNHLLFYIKIATHNDPSKSLWLGEFLRTGEEMKASEFNNTFNVSRTKLYNSLFKRRGIGTSNKLLPYLFYENTTIIRKTRDSFKNARLFVKNDKDTQEKTINENEIQELDFEKSVERIKELVKENYNYNWFKLFFPIRRATDKYDKVRKLRDNAIDDDISAEGIPLIEKYVLLSWTGKLLNELSSDPQKSNIFTFENNADKLISSFAEIMGAQAAFITIRPRPKKYYTLSVYYKSDCFFIHKEAITYDNTFYCTQLLDDCDNLSEEIDINKGRPFVLRKQLTDSNIPVYGESFNLIFKRAAYLSLEYKSKTVGIITFLYNDQDLNGNNLFLRKTQELGRLLLLLKPQIDKYVQVVAENKQFEEWVRNQHMARLTYAENHGLDLAGWDFDNLSEKDYLKIYNGIFMLSNVVIRNLYGKLMNEHEIKLSTEQIMISEIFDEKFMSLLSEISTNIFHTMNIEFDTLSEEKDVTIPGLKPVLQSYVIQLLKNAARHADSRHIYVHFFNDCFEIENDIWKNADVIASMKEQFEKKYDEKAMESFIAYPQNIDDYGFTLLSLYYYIKSLGMESEFGFRCDDKHSLFNDKYRFFVKIKYKKIINNQCYGKKFQSISD